MRQSQTFEREASHTWPQREGEGTLSHAESLARHRHDSPSQQHYPNPHPRAIKPEWPGKRADIRRRPALPDVRPGHARHRRDPAIDHSPLSQ
jgi:hypothetical protein